MTKPYLFNFQKSHFKLLLKAIFLVFSLPALAIRETFADMDELSKGWPTSLKSIESVLSKEKSYLLLTIQTPDAYIDLRSAESLRRSLLATPLKYLRDNAMGHLSFGWQCPQRHDSRKKGFTSQSGVYERPTQTQTLIQTGWGLASLMAQFTDGSLLTPEENEKSHFSKFIEAPNIKMIVLVQEVESFQCDKSVGFLADYANPKYQGDVPPQRFYGLTLSPEKLEGGACNSLAIAALNQANFFGVIGDKLFRSFGLPNHLMGRPRTLDALSTIPYVNQEVPVGTTIGYSQILNTPWTYFGYGPTIEMADTELLILFLRTVYEQELQNTHSSFWQVQKNIKPLRRWMFSRNIDQFNEPSGLTISSQEIDKNFDQQAEQVVLAAKKWYTEKFNAGARLRRVKWGSQLAFVLSK